MPVKGGQTISKAIGLIRVVAEADNGRTFTELRTATDQPKATLHRLIQSMLDERLLRYDATDKCYRLGYGFLELAGVAWSRLDLRLAAGDALETLSHDSGESVQLALLDGTDVLFIGDLASPQGGRPGAVVGKRRAAYCTAEGKVMLAFAEERDRVLDQLTFRRLTPRTVTTRAELAAQLLVTRRNGFALEDEEQELGMRRLAAAIFDRHSQPIAAVGLTVPVERCGQRRIGELAEMLSSSAKEITRNCGGRTPRGSEPVAFVPEILEIEAPSWLPEGDVPC